MPELPPSNQRPLPALPSAKLAGGVRYAELHAKTNFSFLEGASHPDELVVRAAELGYGAFAVSDRNSLAGVVRERAAKKVGLKLIVGENHSQDAPPVVLWTSDRASYGRLARLITVGRRHAKRASSRPRSTTWRRMPRACWPASPASRKNCSRRPKWSGYRDLFADRCYLLAEFYRARRRAALDQLIALAANAGAAGGRRRCSLSCPQPPGSGKNALTAVGLGCTWPKPASGCFPMRSGTQAARGVVPSGFIGCRRRSPARWNCRAVDVFARRVAIRISGGAGSGRRNAAGVSDAAGLGRRRERYPGGCRPRCES